MLAFVMSKTITLIRTSQNHVTTVQQSDSNSESGSEEEIRDSRRDLDRGKPTRGRGWRDNKEKRGEAKCCSLSFPFDIGY